ncbi:Molybdenum cofactor sulfurase-like protein [Drosera capensis]
MKRSLMKNEDDTESQKKDLKNKEKNQKRNKAISVAREMSIKVQHGKKDPGETVVSYRQTSLVQRPDHRRRSEEQKFHLSSLPSPLTPTPVCSSSSSSPFWDSPSNSISTNNEHKMMSSDKERFLAEFGDDYGYPKGPKSIDQIRYTEFKRLNGTVYLDHAGATLYSELQMEAVFRDLTSNLYGNPHSRSDSSMATANIVRECRQKVLDYFNASAKEYKCIFTSGATAALKLVGETFPWSSQSCFTYTMDNHNSVIGLREYALNHDASVSAIELEETVDHTLPSKNRPSIKISQHPLLGRKGTKLREKDFTGNCFVNWIIAYPFRNAGKAFHLFAFPSECNFSGAKFSLDLVRTVKEQSEGNFGDLPFRKGRWFVLIDAAKGCTTDPPDLSKFPADFVVMSFYKLFGYPTGLGALLVRSEATKLMKKTYFSGGTVEASIADMDYVKYRDTAEELFEDGTASFLSIVSIRHGFNLLNTLTVSAVSRHIASLATYLRRTLLGLKHDTGARACVLYGGNVSSKMGSIISFNLKRSDGSWIGYHEVEKLASLSGIQLRTGCFCNPGACARYLGLSHLELLSNIEAGHVCWDDNDIINGKPTGAVRVSFGYMSTFEDAKTFVDFIVNSFVSIPSLVRHGVCLEKCSRSVVGLLYDREWLLKSHGGEILTQKRVPDLSLIKTYIDLNSGVLMVESPRCTGKLKINLESEYCPRRRETMDLNAQRFDVDSCTEDIDRWFSKAIAQPCMLLRCSSSKYCLNNRGGARVCRDVESSLSFVNEAQFLLISEASLSDLNTRLCSKVKNGRALLQVSATRFRPNLVISGGKPYDEDEWTRIRIGNNAFTSLGGCNRCQMINFYHQGGQVLKSNEPLATLASYRRAKGRILFGILLRRDISNGSSQEFQSWLHVGQQVHAD